MEKITSDNFITDFKTNKVYISSLIDGKTGALDAETRSALKSKIKEFSPNCKLLYNTMDVWARDYMPIQLTEKVFLNYTYKPDYLQEYPRCVTNWQLHGVNAKKPFDFEVVTMPIILDGGNVVKAILKGKPCIIMCDKVLLENNIDKKNKTEVENFRKWWKEWWNDNFCGTEMELVLLPWEGEETNPIGHADGMVRYIGDNRVLMTNYLDFDKRYEDNFGEQMENFLKEEIGFDVKTIEFWDKFKNDRQFQNLFEESWCYINYLQLGNRLLVPKLSYAPLNEEAMRQIKAAFGDTVVVELIDVDMTSTTKEMGSENNSGGALNCLTWTTFERDA